MLYLFCKEDKSQKYIHFISTDDCEMTTLIFSKMEQQNVLKFEDGIEVEEENPPELIESEIKKEEDAFNIKSV